MIKLSPPVIGYPEEQALIKVLRSGNIAQGAYVEKFEKKFASYIGVPYAVAVNNGTSALIASLFACGIKPDDEIITTAFTFGATANSILAVGARVKFVDIDPQTFCIDPIAVKKAISKKTKGVIAVDIFGHCANWKELEKLAKEYGLILVEDAAQAHGAAIGQQRAGSFGDAATFSFYASKNMTTGEGGMVTTKRKDLYEKLLLLRNHGMKSKYRYDTLGFNWRMTNISAAMGLCQLARLEKLNKRRQQNAQYLTSLIHNTSVIKPTIQSGYSHVFHQYVIRVTDSYSITRDKLAHRLKQKRIETAIHYPFPLHTFPHFYEGKRISLPYTEEACAQVLSLPIHPRLTKKELTIIANTIQSLPS